MSVISTVASATPTITMDAIDAHVREGIEREKHPNNQKRNTENQLSANASRRIQQNLNRNNRCGDTSNLNILKPNNPIRKKRIEVCHYFGRLGISSVYVARKLPTTSDVWKTQVINTTIINITNHGMIGTRGEAILHRTNRMVTTKTLASKMFKLIFLQYSI